MDAASSPPPVKKMPLLVVAAALIDGEGRVLVQQRPLDKQHGGLWEFPGGKVEPGETPEAALVRELAEELGIAVDPDSLAPVSFASTVAGDRPVVLLLFDVPCWQGEPRAFDAAAIAWVNPRALADWAMPPADYPLAAALAGRR